MSLLTVNLRASALLVVVIAGACGGPTPGAAIQTSPPTTQSFAVLATIADPYTASIVANDGKVVATAQASEPAWASGCGGPGSGAHVPLPISTTGSRLYFMDRQGVIRYLAPHGETGQVTRVALGGSRYSMFTVSPDDRRIAVIVSDYTTGAASQRLYVEDLNGGTNHVEILSDTGAFGLWPVGWHGNYVIVAKVTACTSGGGPFCCGPLELYVVDPASGARKFTIGGPQCVIVGDPSSAGAICEDTTYTRADVVDWTGVVNRSFVIQGPTPALLAPDGKRAALNVGAHTTTFDPAASSLDLYACGWIDSMHVISSGPSPDPPRIADVGTGNTVTVAAEGQCAGRIPGGL